jgi:hypothetical protein
VNKASQLCLRCHLKRDVAEDQNDKSGQNDQQHGVSCDMVLTYIRDGGYIGSAAPSPLRWPMLIPLPRCGAALPSRKQATVIGACVIRICVHPLPRRVRLAVIAPAEP